METIRVKKLRGGATLPTFGSRDAAGADLYACLEQQVTIAPGETVFIPTELAMEIPKGYAGLIYARSGMACKRGLAPANKVGVIDSDYRGEICVGLINQSRESYTIAPGERIAQLVLLPVWMGTVAETDELEDTLRGEGGFGSTGER